MALVLRTTRLFTRV